MTLDQALVRTRARILSFQHSDDSGALFTPEAEQDRQLLWAELHTPDALGPDVLRLALALGWYHWCRYLVLPSGQDQEDLDRAAALLRPLRTDAPDRLPIGLLIYLDTVRYEQVRSLLDLAMATGAQGDLEAAVRDLRALLADLGQGHPMRLNLAEVLSHALDRLHPDTTDPAILDEIAALDGEILRTTPADHVLRPQRLFNLSMSLRRQYEHCQDGPHSLPETLTVAIVLAEETIASLPAPGVPAAEAFFHLHMLHRLRYLASGGTADLDAAITLAERAAAAAAPDDPETATYRFGLAAMLLSRWNLQRRPADLCQALPSARAAVTATPHDHAKAEPRVKLLCGILRERYLLAGDEAAFHEAVEILRDWADRTPPGSSRRLEWLTERSDLLTAKAATTTHPESADLAELVRIARQVLVEAGDGHPGHPTHLAMLAAALHNLGQHGGNGADQDSLVSAVAMARRAVAATTGGAGHEPMSAQLSMACAQLLSVAQRSDGDPDLLDPWVEAAAGAVAATPEGDPERPARLHELTSALHARYESTRATDDLDRAVEAGLESALTTPSKGFIKARRLMIAADQYGTRYNLAHDRIDLDQRITLLRTAAAAVSGHHESVPGLHSDRALSADWLARALLLRYQDFHLPEDLDEGIEILESAVAALPPAALRDLRLLISLAWAHLQRHELTGRVTDLDAGVRAAQDAVALTAGPDQAGPLTELSNMLLRLGSRLGSTPLIDHGLEAARIAVDAVSTDDPEYARYLGNLANLLRARATRPGAGSELDESVAVSRRALAATPSGHPHQVRRLVNLAGHLRERFRLTGRQEDAAEALELLRAAAELLPGPSRERGLVLAALGILLATEGISNAGVPDSEAEAVLRDALDLLPAQHPAHTESRISLGVLQCNRATGEPQRPQFDRGMQCLAAVARDAAAHPDARLRAAMLHGHFATTVGHWRGAADSYVQAVSLLPLTVPRALERLDQEHELAGRGAGLAGTAAALLINTGDWQGALEVLEQGRGVLLGQALELRSDIGDLHAQRPDLAARFEHLRHALEDAGTSDEQPAPAPARQQMSAVAAAVDSQDHARQLSDRWDGLLGEIRALPGFERFLLPARFAALSQVSAHGAVIVLNTSDLRSDALLLSEGAAIGVRLPGLELRELEARTAAFREALAILDRPALPFRARRDAERSLSAVLGWLWDTVVEPVLDPWSEVFERAPGDPLPRVWWCPVGPLAQLPLHAAGHHQETGSTRPRTALDRAVSSYTPTLRSLLHLRSRDRSVRPPAGPLMVAMPQTPGAAPLPVIPHEIASLRKHLPDTTVLTGEEATRARVLAQLPAHSWVHFACHGESDPEHPSAGQLLVHDHQQHPLTVQDLTRLRLDEGELAFLSACRTAEPSGVLPDESIHITSALQLAGYRHVIGSLWSLTDGVAARVTDQVYADLTAGGTPDARHAARALHTTVRRLRDESPWTPSRWAGYIHAGI
ncbi:CHAT domain-containing protein [Streptomyces sp. NPDC005820]|uniref:CHAT domain-containing protein n=1 Tax=Streptomyces sp. NPDC005820 TaxID=3157069 RepID=UPI0033E4A93C